MTGIEKGFLRTPDASTAGNSGSFEEKIPPLSIEEVHSFVRNLMIGEDALTFWNFRKNYGKGFNLLDVGAGNADFIRHFHNEEKSNKYYEYDLPEGVSPKPFDKDDFTAVDTSKHLIESFNSDWYKEGSIDNLPFADSSFYYVVANGVVPILMHQNLEYPYTESDGKKVSVEKIINELIRVTKSTGQIRFDIPSGELIEESVDLENQANMPTHLKTPGVDKKIAFLKQTIKFLQSLDSENLRVVISGGPMPAPESINKYSGNTVLITKNPKEYDELVKEFEKSSGYIMNPYFV
jgi:hypothetical protein